MSSKKPLCLYSGVIKQLQAGDSLDATLGQVDIISLTNVNANPVVIGQPVYVPSADNVDLAKADASATVQVLGLMAVASTANNTAGNVQKNGTLTATDNQWKAVTANGASLSAGTVYYLDSATAGKITATAPTADGKFVCRLGIAISTLEFEISIQEPVAL
jgi:hypothetical protein